MEQEFRYLPLKKPIPNGWEECGNLHDSHHGAHARLIKKKDDYAAFLERKRHSVIDCGIPAMNGEDGLFDYQKFVADRVCRRGRMAGFLDTGLGKTLIQLIVAQSYMRHFNRRVLIITPLAVAFQFIKEAEKFGIDDIEYSKDGKFTKKIVVCNYERLEKFDSSDFIAIFLDESSILKNFKGAIKSQITGFIKHADYRFLFTATPSPNDYIELGTSSEALGYMGYMDMLTKFFTNNQNSVDPNKVGVKWVLKGHAEKDFFAWVSSWSISMRKPSDLGFDDSRHVLPPLFVNEHKVYNESNLCIEGQYQLMAMPSTRLTEVREEQKSTIDQRCEKAFSLTQGHDHSVYWTNLNAESELLNEIDPDATEIRGSMPIEKKEEILLAFAERQIKRLITKPKITGFGLNWQHCNHTVYFPTFSFEQYYQAIRRFWRFGQQNPVTCDLVYSDGQEKVTQSLQAKAKKADALFNNLNAAINSNFLEKKTPFDKPIIKPSFL